MDRIGTQYFVLTKIIMFINLLFYNFYNLNLFILLTSITNDLKLIFNLIFLYFIENNIYIVFLLDLALICAKTKIKFSFVG